MATSESLTATTTWTCPSVAVNGFDVTEVMVDAYGGGGGGGNGVSAAGGGGGGGGGFSRKNAYAVTPGAVYTVTIGAQVNAGQPGQVTWFSPSNLAAAVCLANGGSTGTNASGISTPGVGGAGASAAGAIGDVKNTGGNGANGTGTAGGGGGGGAGDSGNGGAAAGQTGGTGSPSQGGNGGTAPLSGAGVDGTPGGGAGSGGGILSGAGGRGARGGMILTYQRQFARSQTVTTPTQPASIADTRSGGGSTFARTQTAASVGPADVVNSRVYGAVRAQSLSVGPADVATSRIVAFTRSQTVTTPTQPADVASTRAGGSAFTRSNTVTTPTQPAAIVNSRQVQYNRMQVEYPPGLNPDWPIVNGNKSISGFVKDEDTGAVIAGATVKLFRQSDDFHCQTTVSAGDGSYSFVRDQDDPYTYWTLAYSVNGLLEQVHGTSDRDLAPV